MQEKSSKSKPLPQGVSIRPRYMSTNKGNLTIRAEMLADSTKKAQIAPKCFGSPAQSCPFFKRHFQLVGGKHHPNPNVLNFSRKKGYAKKSNLLSTFNDFITQIFKYPKKNYLATHLWDNFLLRFLLVPVVPFVSSLEKKNCSSLVSPSSLYV